jgi:hypothetical protein
LEQRFILNIWQLIWTLLDKCTLSVKNEQKKAEIVEGDNSIVTPLLISFMGCQE